MDHMRQPPAGIRTNAGRTHAHHLRVRGGFFIHGAVGNIKPAHDKAFLAARLQGAHLTGKILLHRIGGNVRGDTPAIDATHTIADNAPGGTARQLLRAVVILVFLAAAADVSNCGNLHSGWFLSVVFSNFRPAGHPRGAAGRKRH